MDILDYIPTGHDQAVSRKTLCLETGLKDREVRQAIHEARREKPIINLSDGNGYYIPDLNDTEDCIALNHYVQQEESRLKSIGWSLKAARKLSREHEAVS